MKIDYEKFTSVSSKYKTDKFIKKTCISVSRIIPEIVDSDINPLWLGYYDIVTVYEIVNPMPNVPECTKFVYFSSMALASTKPEEVKEEEDLILLRLPEDIFNLITSEELYNEKINK